VTENRTASALDDSLDALNGALQSLIEDLGKERDALRLRSSADDLEQIAVRKSLAVEHVANLYTRMREALVRSTGGEGVGDALSRLRGLAPALGGRVERLVELTRTCQHSNQENGALIGAGLHSSGNALDTLRKLSAANATGTYSASGRTDSPGAATLQFAAKA